MNRHSIVCHKKRPCFFGKKKHCLFEVPYLSAGRNGFLGAERLVVGVLILKLYVVAALSSRSRANRTVLNRTVAGRQRTRAEPGSSKNEPGRRRSWVPDAFVVRSSVVLYGFLCAVLGRFIAKLSEAKQVSSELVIHS